MLFINKGKMCKVDGVRTTIIDGVRVANGYKLIPNMGNKQVCEESVVITKNLGSESAKNMFDNYILEFLEMHNNKLDFRGVTESEDGVLCMLVDIEKLRKEDANWLISSKMDYLYNNAKFAKYILNKKKKVGRYSAFVTVHYEYVDGDANVKYNFGVTDLIQAISSMDILDLSAEIDKMKDCMLSRKVLYSKMFKLEDGENGN